VSHEADGPRAPRAVPALHFEGVHKRYPGRPVLEGFGLEVAPGECFGLVGVNGAGKTTCIKALLDLCQIDAGRIRIFDVPHREPRARARLAYLPERFAPPWYLSGRDFLRLASRLRGVALDEREAVRVLAAMSAAGAAGGAEIGPDLLARPVREYSKGMAQKLGVAACLLGAADLLVLDEPMSGLDPMARAGVKRHLRDLRGSGRTVFFSTHLLGDVHEICDRMAILHGGRLRFVGSPAECRRRFDADSLEAAYVACIAGA